MKINMNCYGQDVDRLPIETRCLPIVPYQFKTINNVAYCRYDSRSLTAIQRMEKTDPNNQITQTWAYGNWENCQNLTYHPINTILTVEV